MLSTPVMREAERKQVTVMFADLRGSMELIAGRDPEEAQTMLDAVLQRMMEAVHRYEGTVNQVMGDGIMALFGAPLAYEDHAVRACYAALEMQQSVRAYADELSRARGVSVQIRVGLNSGPVVARSIPSDFRTDYSAVGETTHLAARMEQVAIPGTIVMTAETHRLVEGHVDAKALGAIAVKGRAAPVETFEVLGVIAVRSRLHSVPGRELTPFVGRQSEVEYLRRALARTEARHGQVLAVVGDPGVGKSRLLLEVVHSPWARGWQILEGGAFPYEKATPYLWIAGLLRAYFRLQRDDDLRAISSRVTERLTAINLTDDAPALLAILDVPVDSPPWRDLNPTQRRRQTREAVRRVLLRASEVEPLLVILEDLQWIDAESQAVLDHLVGELLGARLLLLVTYRPEYQHGWANRVWYGQLRLEPLPPDGARELLARVLGNGPDLDPLKALLVARTEGNPFFLEESIRTLLETGVLTGVPGAYRLARPVETVRVPATVEAVLAARIDRLPQPEKHLLQCAAVIGRDVPLSLLRDIADQAEAVLRRSLTQLQASEFIYETRPLPEPEYAFKHALTQEVAYGALLQSQRRLLHARVVETYERLYPARGSEQVERLAEHAVNGELWAKAAVYLRRAGGKAASRGAAREAATIFERALGVLGRLEEDREVIEQAIEVRLDLQSTLIPLGDLERTRASLDEAQALADRLGDPRRTGQVAAAMSHFFWWTGEPSLSAEFGYRAWDIAGRAGDLTLQVVTNLRIVQAYFAMGDYRQIVETGKWSLETLTGDLARETFGLPALPAITIRAFVGRSMATLGHFEQGIAMVEEGVRLAREADHPYTTILAWWGASDTYLMRGDLLRAIPILERGLELCHRGDFDLMTAIIGRLLGEAYAMAGRHGDADDHVRRSVDHLTAMRYIPALPAAWAGLGEVHLHASRFPEALEAAQRADALCEQHGQHGTRAGVLRLLGDIHAAEQPPKAQESEGAYRRALALTEILGMRPLKARCHLGLGKLLARVGERVDAQRHLSLAVAMCQSLELSLWGQEAHAASLALSET
jgi:class 3 adenylate cyclase/tetratricopeptide (TPR) repeat protein